MFAVLAFVLGALTWSFCEYALHAWVFHGRKPRTFMAREHRLHHARVDYFAPTRAKAATAAGALGVFGVPAVLLAGWAVGLAWVTSFIGSYALYELLHRRAHTHPPRGPYGRWLRKSHFYHHFQQPDRNHGVTSPLWDFVFRTYTPPTRVQVPARQAMTWLVDPGSGEVRAAYAADYLLRHPRGPAEAAA